MRRWVFTVIGVLLFVVGLVWVLQGLNVLGGSFMSGQKLWFAIGLLVALVGVVLSVTGIRGWQVRRH